MDLDQSVAVVTGGSNGVGAATGKKLSDKGAEVYILDLEDPSYGNYIETDVSKEKAVKQAFSQIQEEEDAVDLLVNNAGLYHHTPQDEFDSQMVMDMVETNLLGYRMCFTYALPLLQKSEDGNVINISSGLAQCPEPYSDIYGATKAGVNSMIGSWAVEDNNVRANAIMVGPVKTSMLTENFSDEELEEYLEKQLVDQFTQPQDVAEFLADIASQPQMSGEILSIGGEVGQTQYGV